ncbi:hypothetical protein E2C01_034638 [Portunus trituberculatus]|uniref:Uncharacterized protein n=1 Tax=Portunus trituberculatus TaxID=210409 RepID=A0A5B7F690_PORTR|nr:hypothetical protein [Portunus trituberculatus]
MRKGQGGRWSKERGRRGEVGAGGEVAQRVGRLRDIYEKEKKRDGGVGVTVSENQVLISRRPIREAPPLSSLPAILLCLYPWLAHDTTEYRHSHSLQLTPHEPLLLNVDPNNSAAELGTSEIRVFRAGETLTVVEVVNNSINRLMHRFNIGQDTSHI